MATTTITRNLKLHITSDMSADTKYNLLKIDTLASAAEVDTFNDVIVRSVNDIHLIPQSNDIGGAGTGGNIFLGSPNQILDSVQIWATSFLARGGLSLQDQGTGGTKSLSLLYNSTLDGPVDNTAGRSLSIDLQGANRQLILGGNLTTTGNVTLQGTSTVTLPSSGTLATLAGLETLTGKTIDAVSNTIINLTNSSIQAGAGIQGTKISPDFGSQAVRTSSRVEWYNGSIVSSLSQASSGQSSSLSWELPPVLGTVGQVLSTDGSGKLLWSNSAAGSLSGLSDVSLGGLVAGQILQYDGARWVNASGGSGGQLVSSWIPGDGASKTIIHNFSTLAVAAEILDENQQTIEIDTISRNSSNSITLTASQAPTGTWTVLLQRIS